MASKLDFNQHYKSTVKLTSYIRVSTWAYGTYRIIEQRKLSQACASLPNCYDIDSDMRIRWYMHESRPAYSPHTVFVFRYEVERLVDVCVCVNLPVYLTCILLPMAIVWGLGAIESARIVTLWNEFWKFYIPCLLDQILHYMFVQKA